MRITIIADDGTVIVEGAARQVEIAAELVDLARAVAPVVQRDPPAIHAVQWFGDKGWLEFKDGRRNRPLEQSDFALLQPLVDLWTAAEPKVSIGDERILKRIDIEGEALRRVKAVLPEIEGLDANGARVVLTVAKLFDPKDAARVHRAQQILEFAEKAGAAELDKIEDAAAVKAIDPKKAKPFGAKGPAWPK